MKTATSEFVSYLRSLDIKLWADEGRLRYSAPKGAMSAGLRGQLKARKAELLSFVQQANTFQESGGVIERIPRTGDLPLSFAQQRLWFMHYFEGGQSVAYNVPATHSLAGAINLGHLRQSLAQMIERHESLRTTFPMRNGSPVQMIAEDVKIEFPLINLADMAEEEQESAIDEWTDKLVDSPFDLEKGPLLRVALLQLAEDEYLLLAAMHHIISDGWSMEVFVREWTTLYEYLEELEQTTQLSGALNGRGRAVSYPLPELDIQYADFASWQRQWLTGEVLDELSTYWTKQLADAPPLLELPTDYARPPVQTGRSSTIFFEMSAELTHKLNVLSKQSQATLFMTLVTAFVAIFSRYSGQEDVVVGTLIANRNRREIESLIGFFINTLVLRINLSGDPSFQKLLQHVREVTLGAYAHQDMPFEELVRILEPERNLSYNPLFQVMFVWQNVPTQTERPLNHPPDVAMEHGKKVESLIGTGFEEESGTAMFDLFIAMWEEDQQIKGSLTYNSDLFELDTMARMGEHVGKALETMVSDAQQRVMGFPLLSDAERHQLLVEWNKTQIEYPKDKCFHERFEQQVRRTPNDVAVEFEDEPFTYYELNRSANKLAHWLIEQGIGPDTIVALLAYRSIDFLISMLAIFKAGGAYLPIDPLQPPARISQIFQQSEVPLVLSTLQLAPLLVETLEPCEPDSWPTLLFIEDALNWPTAADTSKNPPLRNTPHDLAYVIYTSGSTGIPKGAMVEHKGMLNHLYAKIRDLDLTNLDIVAQNAPQSFDISVWQFLAGLLVGGQVNIFNDHAARDPNLLLKQVAEQGITTLEVVPSLLAMMLEVMPNINPDLSELRWLIPTGEALPPQLCRQWLEQFPHVPVINAYGPTECSDDVTHYPIYEPPAEEVFNIPIGRPIINTNLYILDRFLQPVPIGVAGELYVGGVGVGRGYLNDPERTQKAFVANPFAHAKAQSSQGAKKKKKKNEFLLETSFAALPDVPVSKENDYLYKTGDKARYLADGNIEFLGRLDHQVKIRGFRIELGEIEAALMQLPMVYQTAVVARADGRKSKRLVAYVVPNQEPAPTVSELRRFLKEKLPDYMVPGHFVTLDALPLTHNGKVNRRDLEKRPLIGAALDDEFVPPRNPVELELVRIWQELLEVNPIGVRDNFFDLGGHSLLAVRLMSRIEARFGGNLPLTTLFQSPTIEELALVVSQDEQPVSVSAFSCLVPIQPMGKRRPFFAIHALGGGVFSYMPLSRRLGFEQPFYGMQAVGFNGEGEPFNRIEAMAAHYIKAMQSVQPEGPYQLGGWSSGGIIAFEMAQQLHKAGHEVALLALIDSYALTEPAPKQKEMDVLAQMVEDLSELLDEAAPGASKQVQRLPAEEQVQQLLEKANALNLLPPEISSQQGPHLLKVFTANNQAASYYTTQPYAGRITLLYANQVATDDPTRGWSQLAQGGLELYSIPSDHMEMLEEPVVELVAERLAALTPPAR